MTPVPGAMMATAFHLDGYRIVRSLGVVRGVAEVLRYGTAVVVEPEEPQAHQ
jgi:uncharacterized protein YbjQ (UPF0145 family)